MKLFKRKVIEQLGHYKTIERNTTIFDYPKTILLIIILSVILFYCLVLLVAYLLGFITPT